MITYCLPLNILASLRFIYNRSAGSWDYSRTFFNAKFLFWGHFCGSSRFCGAPLIQTDIHTFPKTVEIFSAGEN